MPVRALVEPRLDATSERCVVDPAGHLVQHRRQRGIDSPGPRREQGGDDAVDDDHIGVLARSTQRAARAEGAEREWHLLPAIADYKPSFALAQASTVWFAQIILIVVGHVIAVYLSHLKAGERFRSAQRVLLSQYPMLLLMVMYTMTSLWILAQPITAGG